jgi:uncharacterized radical SAM superfamily protein
MVATTTEDLLYSSAKKLADSGGTGFLLSGGSDITGKLPIYKFKDIVKKIKHDFNLMINVHTGLLDPEDIIMLKEMNIDNVSFDMVGSDKTIKNVFGVDKTVEDYANSLKLLDQSGINYTPHIVIGIDWGKINGEYSAIDILKTMDNFKKVIFIVLIPTKHTAMEHVAPPKIEDIKNVFKYSKDNISKDHVLGCMRPRYMTEIETAAIDYKFSGIVIPSKNTEKYALSRGYNIVRHNYCCSL